VHVLARAPGIRVPNIGVSTIEQNVGVSTIELVGHKRFHLEK
jgi:hypothetical protein